MEDLTKTPNPLIHGGFGERKENNGQPAADSEGSKNSSHNVFAAFFVDLRHRQVSSNTLEAYQGDLENFGQWYAHTFGEEVKPEIVTELDLAEYRQYLIQKYRPATVNRRLTAVRRWLEWALEKGIIGKLPALPKQIKQERLAPKALSKKEQNALLRAVERSQNPRDKALIYILLFCGLRVGEVANLRIEDLEIKDRMGKLTVRSGKGAKYREVPIPAPARAALREYLGDRQDGLVFMGQRGPLTEKGIQNILKKYEYQARLDKLTPHMLRHTCATNLLNAGVDLVKVAAILGHENLNTTAIYTRPKFEELMAAVEKEKF